jgi:hypothetical protein
LKKLLQALTGKSSNYEDLLECSPLFHGLGNKYLGVSITKEIANSVLLVVASYLHADSAMIKLVTFNAYELWLKYGVCSLLGQFASIPSCGGLSMVEYYCSICKFFNDKKTKM